MSPQTNHDLRRVRERLETGVADGLHVGAQLYVSQRGQAVADFAVGEARLGVPLTPDHLTLWMSSTKAVTSVAVAQQLERGALDLDARVADYLPDFAQGGKENITLRHVLTHTGGFRPTPFEHPEDDWETIIAKICAMAIERDWQPGEKAGYHVHTG
ncbi:MAG: serine hydrolase domain-containing protein, partial [Phycisphaeraceae bacterium]